MRKYQISITTKDEIADMLTVETVDAECMTSLEDVITLSNWDEKSCSFIEVASFDRRNPNRTIDVKVIK